MKTGAVVWDATLEDYKTGHSATIAPLVVKDKVIVGAAGGEYGIRAFIDAYDAATGKRAWRFYTVPAPGEPGNDTWAGDSWKTGGASVWVTGAYDAEQNLLLYGIGNPGPDYHSDSRKGDNLYSNSLVALDADTGKLKWHYQFTPHDVHDWDATEVPILADLPIGGQTRKVVMFANRNGFYYTLDRTNGKLIVAKPFVITTWAKEIGADGRPVLLPGHTPDEKGDVTCPDLVGGTNFWPPSFDPSTRMFFVNAREVCMTYYRVEARIQAGRAIHRRRRAARARVGESGLGRVARDRSRDRRAEVGIQVPVAVDVRHPDDRVGPAVQRRRRRQPAGARFAQRQAAVALSDGRDAARHVADDLHDRWPPASAGAVGHDADGVGTGLRCLGAYGCVGCLGVGAAETRAVTGPFRSGAKPRGTPTHHRHPYAPAGTKSALYFRAHL